MELIERRIESEIKYSGKVLSLREDTVELPNKAVAKREVVEHNGAVGVVPITDENEIILVKQFRAGVQKITLELPAGKLELGEDPLDCGIRELEEETGYKAKSFKHLTSFATSPAILEEVIHVYLATDLYEGEINPDEDEFVEIIKMPVDEIKKLIISGEIDDGKTIIGVLLATEYLKSLGVEN
ncbi:MAG: NUDIX hydrolase [Clostridia bacterium]|nr:NUDIX hydrolase [Clostridia bacterium]